MIQAQEVIDSIRYLDKELAGLDDTNYRRYWRSLKYRNALVEVLLVIIEDEVKAENLRAGLDYMRLQKKSET